MKTTNDTNTTTEDLKTQPEGTNNTAPEGGDIPPTGEPDPFDGFEVLEDVPTRGGGEKGQSKYEWDKYPAPSEKDGKMRYASKVITGAKSRNSITKSINNYIKFLKGEKVADKDLPVFATSVLKDGAGNETGIRVTRTK